MKKKLKIPTPKMPSIEERTKYARARWSEQDGVRFTDWNEALVSHSYPFSTRLLPSDIVERTLEGNFDTHEGKIRDWEPYIQECLSELGLKEGEPFFFKLITRSPKDWSDDLKFFSAREVLDAVMCSMRCFDDLCYLVNINQCRIVVRPFVELEKWQEWRVFVKNEEIIGITQYHYRDVFDNLDFRMVEGEIRSFIDEVVTPEMSRTDFVADIIIQEDGLPILLETNPYGLSDPCLFGNYASMDGSFKYTKEEQFR